MTFRSCQPFIGLAQALALIPGISRSGVTMVACLQARLNHEDALHFTFLLATPVILAAGLLEVPKLFGVSHTTRLAALLGGLVAAVAAYLSVKFLTRYFRVGSLTPFAYYSIGVGLVSFFFFLPLALGSVYTTLGRTLAGQRARDSTSRLIM